MKTGSRRARLLVAYDGSSFHGFALNRDVPTVAGALTEALEKITQSEVRLVAAGRTDADRKSTRLNSSHVSESRMPSSA